MHYQGSSFPQYVPEVLLFISSICTLVLVKEIISPTLDYEGGSRPPTCPEEWEAESLEAYNGNREIRKDMKAVRARYSQDRYSEIDEGMVWGDNRKAFCLLKTLASNQRQQGSPAFGRQSSPRSMVAFHLLMDPNILQETEVRPRQPAGPKGWRRAGISEPKGRWISGDGQRPSRDDQRWRGKDNEGVCNAISENCNQAVDAITGHTLTQGR